MKAMDLLKYLDKADPAYIEEASDYNLLLYRKRRKRTRTALAATFLLVALAGLFLTKPALYAWETRNTVTSWPSAIIRIPGAHYGAESSPLYVSAEMPDQKRFAADTPFTLSVGLGQVSSFEYATLSVKAHGFEITDKEGNTVTDRYVRTLSDFDSGDYGMVYRNGKRTGTIAGCSYLEDFTFRFTGSENTTGWGVIEFILQSRTENGSAGDHVTVYYTIQNGVLKLTDKNPVRDGSQNGGQATVLHPEETESDTVTLSKEDFSIRVEMPSGALTPGQFLGGEFHVTAFYIPTQKDYPSDNFTAELIYAESLREKDLSFFIKTPTEKTENGSYISIEPRVPMDAPIGSYDLHVTDPATGFVWMFENMALVLPPDIPAYEDFVFEADSTNRVISQGDNWPGGWDPFFLTLDGEDVAYQCRATLEYRTEQGGESYSITLMESMLSSYLPPDFVSVDAPAGMYDLVVTHELYGYTWRAENFIGIMENPEAERFGLYHDMGKKLTVSRSSGETYPFTVTVENRGDPFTVTESPTAGFLPDAYLYQLDESESSAKGLGLLVKWPFQEERERTVSTGETGSLSLEIRVKSDTPCGLYDLVVSYGGCVQIFEDVVEVVP